MASENIIGQETIRAYLQKKISSEEFTARMQKLGVTAGAAFAFAETLAKGEQNSAASGALNVSELKLVEAIAGRIIPATDTPGAIEAGAANYINLALAGAYQPHLAFYRRAIGELERHCVMAFGGSFAELDAVRQDEILENLEAGKIGAVGDGAKFFELVRRHVMEGFFGEPNYGGNRDLIGWKLVGFPGQRYGYDDPYINRVVDLPPIASNLPPRKGE